MCTEWGRVGVEPLKAFSIEVSVPIGEICFTSCAGKPLQWGNVIFNKMGEGLYHIQVNITVYLDDTGVTETGSWVKSPHGRSSSFLL